MSTPYPGITPMTIPPDSPIAADSELRPDGEEPLPSEFEVLVQQFKETTDPEKRKKIVDQLKNVPGYLKLLL